MGGGGGGGGGEEKGELVRFKCFFISYVYYEEIEIAGLFPLHKKEVWLHAH